jgi:hypothetical protein
VPSPPPPLPRPPQVRFSRVQKGVTARWFLDSDWEH